MYHITSTDEIKEVTSRAVGAKRKKHDPEHVTEIRIFPDHQAEQSNPQHSEASRHDLRRGTRKATWTPHQSYDNQGCANFHENSEGVVLTREDKTIESAVPFPAPEIGDNWGLSPFHPRIIIVIGECPLLSPV